MAFKRAKFITVGDDPVCQEIQKFVEDAGYLLDLRDVADKPLTYKELKKMIGYLDVSHFLNPLSPAYAKRNLDKQLPERNELYQILADDNSLLRKPIILTPRLLTVGCNKQKIMEMLQLSGNALNLDSGTSNGTGAYSNNSNGSNSSSNNNHRNNNHRRYTNSKNSSRESVSGK